MLAAGCRTAAPPPVTLVPDPLGPGAPGPPLSEDAALRVRRALALAQRGGPGEAAGVLASLPADHPVVRLARLEVDYLNGKDVAGRAAALAGEVGSYLAAWRFAAEAADRAGDLTATLAALRKVEELAPGERSRDDVRRTAERLVAATVARGSALIERGEPAAALELARHGLKEVPGAEELRMLVARSALEAGEPRAAAAMLPALPDSPQGLALKGRVALALHQPQVALELLRRLPASDPGRCALVRRAREEVRMANAPPYLAAALESPVLKRGQLAAILVWELPDLEARATGAATVFEDVVPLPEQQDIVTVTRAGVMKGDTVTRRFGPGRVVSPAELRAVIERVARVLGRPVPHWCDGRATAACVPVPEALDGREAAFLARRVGGEEEEPCH